MTKIAVSGGAGYVGRFIVDRLLAEGHEVVVLGRRAPARDLYLTPVEYRYCSLANTANFGSLFSDCQAFVHAAFHHEDGKYRDGEGDDPIGFRRLNHDGSLALFNAAKNAGVQRAVFLSSRAVYGVQPVGSMLREETDPHPDTLYGQVKLETEHALANLEDDCFLPAVVRPTGVYGASACTTGHKWSLLFDAFDKNEIIQSRVGTEVHGQDLADAINLLLASDRATLESTPVFNVSDILLDRRELLDTYAQLRGRSDHHLPLPSDKTSFNEMDCSRLKRLGWSPRGKLDLSDLVNNTNR